jgi:hypothetical protein
MYVHVRSLIVICTEFVKQDIQSTVERIRHLLHGHFADDTEAALWNRVCYRLDVLCLVVFNVLNCIAVLMWLAPSWQLDNALPLPLNRVYKNV